MLQRSLLLVLAVYLDIIWSLVDGRHVMPQATLMYFVARTIHEYDYATPLLAFGTAFLMDAWHLDIFGGRSVSWLLVLLLVSYAAKSLSRGHISALFLIGFFASFFARFIQFVLWSTQFRTGTLLSTVTSSLAAGAVIDSIILVLLYRFAYEEPVRKTGFSMRVAR